MLLHDGTIVVIVVAGAGGAVTAVLHLRREGITAKWSKKGNNPFRATTRFSRF